jgi:hypothetical protein
MALQNVTDNTYVDIIAIDDAGSITVASTGTAYSRAFELPRDVSFGWEFLFSSGGAVDVKIELEVSNTKPATEQASDSNWAVPDGASAMSSGITDENVHFLAFAPTVAKYGRLKLTGQGSNAADTALDRARMVISKNN